MRKEVVDNVLKSKEVRSDPLCYCRRPVVIVTIFIVTVRPESIHHRWHQAIIHRGCQ